MYILDTMPDFVKILGYGLSGFAFLLMFFAYLLLRQVISRENASKMIFKSIWAFMGLSFLLTITVGVFSYITGDYKEKTITMQQTGLEVLNNNLGLESLANTAREENVTDTRGFGEIKRKQEKILNEQEAKLDKAEASEEEKKNFTELKNQNIKTLDSLQRSDVPEGKKQELRDRYLIQTKELSKISREVVKRQTAPLTSKATIRTQ